LSGSSDDSDSELGKIDRHSTSPNLASESDDEVDQQPWDGPNKPASPVDAPFTPRSANPDRLPHSPPWTLPPRRQLASVIGQRPAGLPGAAPRGNQNPHPPTSQQGHALDWLERLEQAELLEAQAGRRQRARATTSLESRTPSRTGEHIGLPFRPSPSSVPRRSALLNQIVRLRGTFTDDVSHPSSCKGPAPRMISSARGRRRATTSGQLRHSGPGRLTTRRCPGPRWRGQPSASYRCRRTPAGRSGQWPTQRSHFGPLPRATADHQRPPPLEAAETILRRRGRVSEG
jgi:hypothetical protein